MKLQAKAKVAKEAKSAAKKTEDVPKVSLIFIIKAMKNCYIALRPTTISFNNVKTLTFFA